MKKMLFIIVSILIPLFSNAKDATIDGICYNFNGSQATVTYYDSWYDYKYNAGHYKGELIIPSEVVYKSVKYTVTTIGADAFRNCSSLTSVIIPSSVKSIWPRSFYGCTALNIIDIPNSIDFIGYDAFYNTGFLNNKNDGIIYHDKWLLCFKGDKPKGEIVINKGTKGIAVGAFKDCNELISVTCPNSLSVICSYVFQGCTQLKQVVLGDSLTIVDNESFRKNQFNEDVHKVLVNKGTISTLALWKAGYNPYDIKTQNVLNAPNLVLRESTQTSLTIGIDNIYEGYNYTYEGTLLTNPKTPFIINGLYPNEQVDKKLKVSIGDYPYTYEVWGWWYSNPISPEVKLVKKTASSFELIGEYIEGDAIVQSKGLRIIGSINENIEGNSVIKKGLNPNSNYQVFYEIEVSPKVSNKTQKYQGVLSFVIDDLKLTTQQPKVVSVGNVIVAADSNLDDEEENVGFEWRRTDWTDDFVSNKGNAYLYEGVMEGFIRNLYAEKLWKYRPYYISDSGNTYYGEWVGLDPTNTSYFEPTVHTYAKVDVSEGTATLNGYVMSGTDDIKEQGFEYWTTEESSNAIRHTPQNVQTVTATGQHMSTTLTGLKDNTTYYYRAYVKTAKNITYGEERSFKTPVSTGINHILTSRQSKTFNVYTLSGSMIRHQTTTLKGLPRGIYIVNRKKVMIK